LPYRGPDGAIDGVVLVFADVTKMRQAQADIAHNEGLARQRSHEIETLYRTAPVGMALIDRNRRYLKVNRQFAELSGAPMDGHIGRMLKDVAPVPFDKLERPITEVFERGEELGNLEVSVVSEGSSRDFLIDIYPYEEDGRVTAVGIIVKDVSELRRLEKELRRLMDELQHRVKNTLATVASIIGQTVNTSRADRVELGDTLKRRINALAATHDLLTSRDWRGASLLQILESELLPFGHSDRIVFSGPTVELPPRHALALTMTLHELATNAAKYGALSNPDGKLTIDWALNVDASGRRVTIVWSETGIQPLPAAGVVESFGTRLIKNAIAHDLRGQCEHNLTPRGLACKITVPF
jgi:two-component system CheB/CheR fusion protein